jgi:hypothetical protein|tara:strand:+ start:863 stop:1057 length:195 start_codon:yes stop_codon:yes gene_type:complete
MENVKFKGLGWTKLQKAMQTLDNSIPDYVFDDEDGEELAENISDVYDAISELRANYSKFNLVDK